MMKQVRLLSVRLLSFINNCYRLLLIQSQIFNIIDKQSFRLLLTASDFAIMLSCLKSHLIIPLFSFLFSMSTFPQIMTCESCNDYDQTFIFPLWIKTVFSETCAAKTLDEVKPNFLAVYQFLAAYYPVNSTDIWLQALQTKVKKANSFFLHSTVENSDHALLCIINI